MSSARPLRRLSALVFGAGLLGYVAGAVVVYSARPDPLPTGEAGDRADAIVALAGDEQRAIVALDLWQRGLADHLVVSHVPRTNPVRFGATTAGLLCGVPREQLECIDPEPASTRGEARAVAGLAAERGWDRIIVVTASFHVRRARVLLRQCADAEVRVVAAPWDRSLPRLAWYVVHETGGLLDALLRPEPCEP